MYNSTKRRVEVVGYETQYVDEYLDFGLLASFENRQTRISIVASRKPGRASGKAPITCSLKELLKICQKAMKRYILGIQRIDLMRNTMPCLMILVIKQPRSSRFGRATLAGCPLIRAPLLVCPRTKGDAGCRHGFCRMFSKGL